MRFIEEVVVVTRDLTEKDVRQLSHCIAETYIKKQDLESNLKDHNKMVKEQIAGQSSLIQQCVDKIMSGKEACEIDCDIRYDWETGEKIWTNKENNEVVKKAEITEEERQEDLIENGDTTEGEKENEQGEADNEPGNEETGSGISEE